MRASLLTPPLLLADEKHMSHPSLFLLHFKDVRVKNHFMVQDCGKAGFSSARRRMSFRRSRCGHGDRKDNDLEKHPAAPEVAED